MIEHLRGRRCGKYPIVQRGQYECDLCPRRSDRKRDLCFAVAPKPLPPELPRESWAEMWSRPFDFSKLKGDPPG